MEWISSILTDLMVAYRWIIIGTMIGTVAILSGLATPIVQRLEDAHGALAFKATHPYR